MTFVVPPDVRELFCVRPGQWLTVERDGERRSYSICAAAGAPPRIGVREVSGGAAIHIDATDTKSWMAAMELMLIKPDEVANRREKSLRAIRSS